MNQGPAPLGEHQVRPVKAAGPFRPTRPRRVPVLSACARRITLIKYKIYGLADSAPLRAGFSIRLLCPGHIRLLECLMEKSEGKSTGTVGEEVHADEVCPKCASEVCIPLRRIVRTTRGFEFPIKAGERPDNVIELRLAGRAVQ